jgi:hypothetical protein
MKLGCRYKDMPTFRLVVRQFAIKNEFELGIESTCSYRYRGFCHGGDYPWKIHARIETKGAKTVIVSFFVLITISISCFELLMSLHLLCCRLHH